MKIIRDKGVVPQVIAHRGASGLLPEHTRQAYELALEQNADGVECDIRLSRDGHLVCIHDRRIDRTSNGHGRVSAMDIEELRRFNYQIYPDSPNNEAQLLTLAELIELVLDYRRPVKIFIETKHPIRQGLLLERQLLALLERYQLTTPLSLEQSRVVVMSFSPRSIRYIRHCAPQIPTVLLGSASYRCGGLLVQQLDVTAVGPSVMDLRTHSSSIEQITSMGRLLYCWTVDKRIDIDFCRRKGVHWIATNYPARTYQQLQTG